MQSTACRSEFCWDKIVDPVPEFKPFTTVGMQLAVQLLHAHTQLSFVTIFSEITGYQAWSRCSWALHVCVSAQRAQI